MDRIEICLPYLPGSRSPYGSVFKNGKSHIKNRSVAVLEKMGHMAIWVCIMHSNNILQLSRS